MSSSNQDISIESTDLLTEISVAYYQDGATQEEISKKFSISRAKVGRMLKQARDEGIVEITVKYHPVFSAKIEQRLIERFGVKRALVALDQPNEEAQRLQVSGLVSNYLTSTLKNGMVVTVGQGRNVSSVAHHIGVITPRDCKFVCGIGGIHPRGGMFNADHICRQFAKKYGAHRKPYTRLPMLKTASRRSPLCKMPRLSKPWIWRAKRMSPSLVSVI